MNWITILLASLTGLFSAPGFGVQQVAEQTLRNQIQGADALAVRVDATPSHQLLAGQIDRVRLAGRGLEVMDGVKIDSLDVETDAIDLDVAQLRAGTVALDAPLRAVIRLGLTVDDINQALESPGVTASLQDLSLSALGQGTIGGLSRADVVEAQFAVPESGRIQLFTRLQEQSSGQELAVQLGLGVAIANGYQLQLSNPELTANGESFPTHLLDALIDGVNQEFTLRNLESAGITARLLELEVQEDRVQVVTFVQIDPDAAILSRED